MRMVREFEEQAESKGYQSITKEAGKYAEGFRRVRPAVTAETS